MKTNRLIQFAAAAFALAAFSSAGCAEKQKTTEASVPSANEGATTAATTTQSGPSDTTQPVAAASPDVASARWSDIKDCTYDNRAAFFAGLARLEARVDDQVRELMAKRATMDGKTDTHDWDFAMKEMENARTNLKSMGEELNKASTETWVQQKDKVGEAWVRTQEAYGKVKSSTTS
jgi:UDP-N-acetylglucosamine enolpyruvyl transferase